MDRCLLLLWQPSPGTLILNGVILAYGKGGFIQAADLQPYRLTNAPFLRIPLLDVLLQTHFHVAPQPAPRSLLSFKAADAENLFRSAAPAGSPPATGLALYGLAYQSSARPLTISSDSWLGGPGNWNNGVQWSTGAMPGSNNDVYINNSTPAAAVQLNVSDTIHNLTVGSTSVLNLNDNNSLTIGGSTISNSGTITLNSVGDYTALVIGAGNANLSGTGTVTMSNNPLNYIYGSAAANTLTNQGTIQGSGYIGYDPYIGAASMALVNSGTINANQSTPLTIELSNGLNNSGTLEATNGGAPYIEVGNAETATNTGTIQATGGSSLEVDGGTYTNTGGTIRASGAGSVVTLVSPTINGGKLDHGVLQAGRWNRYRNRATYAHRCDTFARCRPVGGGSSAGTGGVLSSILRHGVLGVLHHVELVVHDAAVRRRMLGAQPVRLPHIHTGGCDP